MALASAWPLYRESCMDSSLAVPSQTRRSVRTARAYFVVVAVLVGLTFVVSTSQILLDESLRRGEILIANVPVVLAGAIVPTLLFVAARWLRRGSRWGGAFAAVAFVLLALWFPMIGLAGVVIGAVAVVGLVLTVAAWHAMAPRAGASAPVRAG